MSLGWRVVGLEPEDTSTFYRTLKGLTRSMVSLNPGSKPGLLSSALLQDREELWRQGSGYTRCQDPSDSPIQLLRWGSSQHRHMRDAVEEEAVGRQVTVGLEDSFLSLEIGSSSRALAGEAGSLEIKAWWVIC